MKPPSLKNVLAGMVLAAGVNAQSQSPPPAKSELNSIEFASSDGVFQTFGSGSSTMAEMRARFEDPRQRAKMREEYRQSFVDSHYGIADTLQLDAASFDRLIELLADQQLEHSTAFYRDFPTQAAAGDPDERMRAQADRATKDVEALREILGQEKLERYQALQPSLSRRTQIRELDERLGDADKLNAAQRERLVVLLHEQIMSSIERTLPLNSMRSQLAALLRPQPGQDLRRQSQLDTIAANEATWREMPESNRQLRQQVAGLLTERQLAMLSQIQAEEWASQQQRIEYMRLQAGLSATIPEQPQVVEAPPAVVTRDVKLSIKVAVNRESPRYLTTVVSSGKPVSMKISEELSLEATTVLFENEAYKLRVEYFETGVTGRRVIGNMGSMGMLKSLPPELRSVDSGSGSGTVIVGSKGYAVAMKTLIEPT